MERQIIVSVAAIMLAVVLSDVNAATQWNARELSVTATGLSSSPCKLSQESEAAGFVKVDIDRVELKRVKDGSAELSVSWNISSTLNPSRPAKLSKVLVVAEIVDPGGGTRRGTTSLAISSAERPPTNAIIAILIGNRTSAADLDGRPFNVRVEVSFTVDGPSGPLQLSAIAKKQGTLTVNGVPNTGGSRGGSNRKTDPHDPKTQPRNP